MVLPQELITWVLLIVIKSDNVVNRNIYHKMKFGKSAKFDETKFGEFYN